MGVEARAAEEALGVICGGGVGGFSSVDSWLMWRQNCLYLQLVSEASSAAAAWGCSGGRAASSAGPIGAAADCRSGTCCGPGGACCCCCDCWPGGRGNIWEVDCWLICF